MQVLLFLRPAHISNTCVLKIRFFAPLSHRKYCLFIIWTPLQWTKRPLDRYASTQLGKQEKNTKPLYLKNLFSHLFGLFWHNFRGKRTVCELSCLNCYQKSLCSCLNCYQKPLCFCLCQATTWEAIGWHSQFVELGIFHHLIQKFCVQHYKWIHLWVFELSFKRKGNLEIWESRPVTDLIFSFFERRI